MNTLQIKKDWWELEILMKAKGIKIDCDALHSLFAGALRLNIFSLERKIPNYDGARCVYNGKTNYSMMMAIKEEWGDRIHYLIGSLTKPEEV